MRENLTESMPSDDRRSGISPFGLRPLSAIPLRSTINHDEILKLLQLAIAICDENIIDEKTFSILTERYQKKHRSQGVLFTIIGAILVGLGIIFVFATSWDLLPESLRLVFPFVPMLIGQSIGIFTLVKKRESMAWRECSAIVWSAGFAATFIMVNTAFNLFSVGALSVVLFSAGVLMLLPIIFCLDSATTLALYYAGALGVSVFSMGENDSGLLVLSLALMLPAFYYTYKKRGDYGYTGYASRWITVAAGAAFCILSNAMLNVESSTMVQLVLVYFSLILLISHFRTNSFEPFKICGLAGTLITSIIFASGDVWATSSGVAESMLFNKIFTVILVAASIAISALTIAKNNQKPFEFVLPASAAWISVFAAVSSFLPSINHYRYDGFYELDALTDITTLIVCITSVLIIIKGAKAIDFFEANVGLLSLIATVSVWISFVYYGSAALLLGGLVFLVSGGALIAVNSRLVKARKKEEKLVIMNGVDSDEEK